MKRYLILLCCCLPFMGSGQIIETVAGNGDGLYNGDSIPATTAYLGYFSSIAIDKNGAIFIADPNNHRIRRVDPITGLITDVAGNGTPGYSGDGNLAINAQINFPGWVAVDTSNNLYLTDVNNDCIRKVNSQGIISTYAGNTVQGFGGDGGLAISAFLNTPQGICIDKLGNLYINDGGNQRVRKVDPLGIITTIAGIGVIGDAGDGGQASVAEVSGIYGSYVDDSCNIYLACMNHMLKFEK